MELKLTEVVVCHKWLLPSLLWSLQSPLFSPFQWAGYRDKLNVSKTGQPCSCKNTRWWYSRFQHLNNIQVHLVMPYGDSSSSSENTMFLYFFFRGEISALFSCASSPSESLPFFVLNLDPFLLFSGLLVFRCSSCRLFKSPWLLLPLLNFLGDLVGESSGLPSLILRLFCKLFIFRGDSSNDSE